jgi:alkane 1-monooxygenase
MTAILRYWLPFMFLAMIPLGCRLGGVATFLVPLSLPISLLGCDWLLGERIDGEPGAVTSWAYRLLPWLYIPLQTAAILWVGLLVAKADVDPVGAFGLTLSTGLTTGIFGMLAAHEMIHSQSQLERGIGSIMLAHVLYMHFAIAHLNGHHRHAATPGDPATARRGENIYAFVGRSLIGQLRQAWVFEKHRLQRVGQAWLGIQNRMLQYLAAQTVLLSLAALVSWRTLVFFVINALMAIMLLEFFNYIAHYGLIRRVDRFGRFERIGPEHSWNSRRRVNNWALFNMGRHSDHHRFAARAYQELVPLAESPELPTGYAGAVLLALFPPLWRRLMDPRVDHQLAQTAARKRSIVPECMEARYQHDFGGHAGEHHIDSLQIIPDTLGNA